MTPVRVPITGGGHAIVDSDTAMSLGTRRITRHSAGYLLIHNAGVQIRLHRFVLGARAGQIVDHINGNKLDNSRANLRLVTASENQLNRHHRPHGVSGYRGVYRCRQTKGWLLQIRRQGKRLYFSHTWRSRHVAALFIDQQLLNIVGPFVKKNFARSIPSNRVCRFIAETRGRIFTVVFSRRSDGRQRLMTCRTGVKSRSKGGASPYCPCLHGLALVWDVHKREYRTIPIERIIAIKFARVNYRIEGNHESTNAQTRRAG